MTSLGRFLPVEDSDIAVVGMAVRVPKARTPEEYWRNLAEGVEAISFFTDAELLAKGVDPALLDNPNFVGASGVLEDAEMFDASFFGYVAREAEIMDPQHRIFLECAWEALEHAGYDPTTYDGLTGVFAGSTMNTYMLVNLMANRNVLDVVGDLQTMIGNDKDYLATRVSYKLDLTGPSYAVQTACSTSLVAVHVACQSLLNGECDMVLAGGSSVRVPHGHGYMYQPGGTSSPDGHCRAFDENAAGSVVGSGAGVVVLKTLGDALRDGDTIHAVIKGSAINNDGAAKASFTAPSVEGQANAVANALAVAGVEPESITYLESHGTGTLLGDPIEVAALTKGFRRTTARTGFCALGSVKTNIGHLDAGAGVVSLIKAVLCLEHRALPPSLNFARPNPKIDFEHSPFFVNTTFREWETDGYRRRAGVNSVGIGGTNAFVVLEEAPELPATGPSRPWQLLVLSARTPSSLDAATTRLADRLAEHEEIPLADVAYTCQVGRRAMSHGRMLVCRDRADALAALRDPSGGRMETRARETIDPPVAFMFSGQGSQHPNMLRGVYEHEPTFRAVVDTCAGLLEQSLSFDLRTVLFPPRGEEEEAAARLAETAVTQPALFVAEYALARLWMEWGIEPSAMIGHSIGEYVAACVAGVFSLEDALSLVAARGSLVQQLPGGAMLSVALHERAIAPLLESTLSLAAVNAPSLSVVAGPEMSISQLERRLSDQGVGCRRLRVSHAFHSSMMEPALATLADLCSSVKLAPPRLPFVSNVSGTWITEGEATDPGYWAKHLREPVRFSQGVGELLAEPARVLLEVGPGEALTTLARQHEAARGRTIVPSARHPQRAADDEAVLLTALGKLWLAGVSVGWPAFARHEARRRVPLPTYPFERQRFWLDARTEAAPAAPAQAEHPLELTKDADPARWLSVPSWTRSAPPAPAAPAGGDGARRVLVFADPSSLSERLVVRLAGQWRNVIAIRRGSSFQRIGERTYTVDPERQRDYEALFDDLRSRGKSFDAILHLWSIEGLDVSADDPASFEAVQTRGACSLTHLARAIGSGRVTCDLRVLVAATGVHEVTGVEALHPAQATIVGPCRVVPQEYSNVTCRVLDLELPPSRSPAEERLVAQIADEIDAPGSDRVVAFRAGYRWVQAFESLGVPPGASQRLREGGVYLITGAFGAVGSTFASYLAETFAAKLVLVDVREDGERTSRLETLRLLGAEVLACTVDVADEDGMRAVVRQAFDRFGALHGVIHAAGVAEAESVRAVAETGMDEFRRQFHAKVDGVRVLERVLEGVPLDFCLLMSSLSSALGGIGTTAYTSACLFMDAFAHEHNRRSEVQWTSVNWETWVSETDGGGPPVAGALRARLAITPDEGVEALTRLLAAPPLPQILVSTAPLQARVEERRAREVEAARESDTAASASAIHERPPLQTGYSAPRDELERRVAEIWQELLGIDRVGIHDNFFELGGQSLLATQLVTRLRQAFGTELPMESLFETPTVAALADAIRAPRGDADDLDEIEEVLREIEELSPQEVEAALLQHRGQGE